MTIMHGIWGFCSRIVLRFEPVTERLISCFRHLSQMYIGKSPRAVTSASNSSG
jgi:hypothetical protein